MLFRSSKTGPLAKVMSNADQDGVDVDCGDDSGKSNRHTKQSMRMASSYSTKTSFERIHFASRYLCLVAILF